MVEEKTMIYTLKNQELTVQLTDAGAEIVSVRRGDACEYIWQGDPAYWSGRTPLMFPICGRLYEGRYTHNGKTYEMGKHGFAKLMEFEGKQTSDTSVTLTLTDSDETRAVYPFAFSLILQ
jgi:galactose mutarotase-like enzyme